MSIHVVRPRLLVIGAAVLTALASKVQVHTATGTQDGDDMVIDSSGTMSKSASGLMRRHQEYDQRLEAQVEMELSAAGASSQDTKPKLGSNDYILAGSNRCNGGGLWKRYESNSVTPGEYVGCASTCLEKEECVGFDIGTTGCNMYTQKAVAIGTWPNVQFNNGEAFAGVADHDAFPQSASDLTVGASTEGANEFYKCYQKTNVTAASNSYYWLIGNGTCSGGGAWNRYKLTPGDYATCENACNLRDECVGFDVGTWEIQESVLQVHQDNFKNTEKTTTGCLMYAQKAVHAAWPGVEVGTNLVAGAGDHEAFPATPHELKEGSLESFNVNGASKCYGKSRSVDLASYYVQLGKQTCDGGGKWKHYKSRAVDAQECKDKCDEKDECIAVDFTDVELRSQGKGKCQLYTNTPLAASSWADVTFDGAGAFAGHGDHDRHPSTPSDLSPKSSRNDPLKKCFVKTHFT